MTHITKIDKNQFTVGCPENSIEHISFSFDEKTGDTICGSCGFNFKQEALDCGAMV
jgi:transcription initiation factor TFIIIB Brf1 subunit/transcription initiation factor TFIIB